MLELPLLVGAAVLLPGTHVGPVVLVLPRDVHSPAVMRRHDAVTVDPVALGGGMVVVGIQLEVAVCRRIAQGEQLDFV